MALENIKGTVKVWRHDHKLKNGDVIPLFNISVGSKKQDGTWSNYSLSVKFANKLDAPKVIKSGTDIEITDSWLSVYENASGETFLHLFVNDFKLVDAKASKGTISTKNLTKEQKEQLRAIGVEV